MSEPEKKADKTEKPKGGGAAILALAIGVLNLCATGFVAYQLMHLPPAGNAEVVHVVDDTPGQLAPLDSFIVNLDEAGAPRYLKASMSLELKGDPEALTAFEAAKHKLRDLFLRYLSSLKIEDTRGESGKSKIRHDLLARAREELGKDRVKDIYFGEFVVQ
jgi:flagellar basal body-associated protein FliL